MKHVDDESANTEPETESVSVEWDVRRCSICGKSVQVEETQVRRRGTLIIEKLSCGDSEWSSPTG